MIKMTKICKFAIKAHLYTSVSLLVSSHVTHEVVAGRGDGHLGVEGEVVLPQGGSLLLRHEGWKSFLLEVFPIFSTVVAKHTCNHQQLSRR